MGKVKQVEELKLPMQELYQDSTPEQLRGYTLAENFPSLDQTPQNKDLLQAQEFLAGLKSQDNIIEGVNKQQRSIISLGKNSQFTPVSLDSCDTNVFMSQNKIINTQNSTSQLKEESKNNSRLLSNQR